MKKFGIFLITLTLLLTSSACDRVNKPGESTTNVGETTTAHVHNAAKAVKENEIQATCKASGRYDSVIYCSSCGEEMARTKKNVPSVGHSYKNQKCIYCGAEESSEDETNNAQASKGLSFQSNNNGTCALTGIGSCKDEDIIIPSKSPAGETVTSIAASAFYARTSLFSVYIPDTVTVIGDDAFSACLNLQTVRLPNNLESIGAGSFGSCDSLYYRRENGLGYIGSEENPYLILAEAVDQTKTTYQIHSSTRFIQSCAFSSATNLTSLVIPDSVVSIGICAFQNCGELVSVTLPKNLTVIEDSLFSSCRKLETVNIPSGVTAIGISAFQFCNALKNVTLPEGLESIGQSAFYFCTSFTSVVIPKSVETVGMSAFKSCTSLTSVVFQNSLDVLEQSMFSDCSNLKNVTLPNGVETIEEYAFKNCIRLETFLIPSTVKTIEDHAFYMCRALQEVTFDQPNGWTCFELFSTNTDGEAVDLTDSVKNAKFLSDQYSNCTWKRS